MERRARIFSVKIILGLVGMMVLAGCAGPKSRMAVLSEPPAAAKPQSDKATIIFYRSHSDSELISASVFDVSMEPPRLVGILSSRMKLAYVAEPGIRHFMVISQTADFMDAELAAGKTYYALAVPNLPSYGSSSWVRFSLHPRVATDPDLADELSGLKWVENTRLSEHWAEANMNSIEKKRDASWPEWQKKPDKPVLKTDDGR